MRKKEDVEALKFALAFYSENAEDFIRSLWNDLPVVLPGGDFLDVEKGEIVEGPKALSPYFLERVRASSLFERMQKEVREYE